MVEILIGRCGNAIIDWGPGLVLAIVMLYGLYRFLRGIGVKIVTALEKPSDSLSQQARSMDRMTESISAYVLKDQSEHREIIILQKIILNRIEVIDRRGEENVRDRQREI